VWLFRGPLGEEVKDEEEQPRQLAQLTELVHPRTTASFSGLWTEASSGSQSG
jgi:hypothetical protein